MAVRWSFFLALSLLLSHLHSGVSRGVVAVLQKANKIRLLEERNRHIEKLLYSPDVSDFDVVVFCEKYIKKQFQNNIQKKTSVPLKFVFVDSALRGAENNYSKRLRSPSKRKYMETICPSNKGSDYFSYGYRGMCQFWFTEFQQFVQEYDWLLRIDDDCNLLPLKSERQISLPLPDHVPLATAQWTKSDYCLRTNAVTGMLNFTLDFQARLGFPDEELNPAFRTVRDSISRHESCVLLAPYTNVMYVNLNWLRSAAHIQKFMLEVKNSGCIFNNRWGDLELWGAIWLLQKSNRMYSIPLPYAHMSHKCASDPYGLSKRTSLAPCHGSQESLQNHFTKLLNTSFELVQ